MLNKMGKAYSGSIQVAAGAEYAAKVEIRIEERRLKFVEAKMLKVEIVEAKKNIRIEAQSGQMI